MREVLSATPCTIMDGWMDECMFGWMVGWNRTRKREKTVSVCKKTTHAQYSRPQHNSSLFRGLYIDAG